MTLDQLQEQTRTSVLVYGPPKAGKTALVGKLASDFTLYWFDLEAGIKTLLNPMMLDQKYLSNIHVFNIPDHRLNPIAIDTLREVFRGGLKTICHIHGKVNCPLCAKNTPPNTTSIDLGKLGAKDIVVIDSLSQLANSAINKATYKEISKPGGEDYTATFHDYAMQGALMNQILSLIQASNLNVVAISHEVDIEKSDTKQKIVPIAGTRNFSATVAKFFDCVVYCTITNKVHRAYSSSLYSPSHITGSRLLIDIDTAKADHTGLLPLFKR
jgi:hypothetical protein